MGGQSGSPGLSSGTQRESECDKQHPAWKEAGVLSSKLNVGSSKDVISSAAVRACVCAIYNNDTCIFATPK